jgi:hypothetical protein
MSEMNLTQRLALAEFLTRHFAAVRAGTLNPEAVGDMTTGERLAAKFAGQVAAWVSMPKPATRASVSNRAAFLAWVKEYLPAEVETVEVVRPGTQAALLAAAKANDGKWLDTGTGEYVVIDGVTVGVGDSSPRVELTEGAAEAIGAAWRAGDIDLTPLLALPAAGGGEAA